MVGTYLIGREQAHRRSVPALTGQKNSRSRTRVSAMDKVGQTTRVVRGRC